MNDGLSLAPPSPVGPLRFAAGVFGAGACASAALGLAAPFSPIASAVAAIACGAFAVRCWRRAAIAARAEAHPRTPAQVRPPTAWQAQQLYLGDGSWWEQRHATRLQQAMTRSLARRADEALSGDPRIFGVLGADAKPMWVNETLANRHLLVVGTTGVGKTKYFEMLMVQAIASGAGVVVLDPKGDWGLASRALDACRQHGRGEAFQLLSLAHPHARHMATYNPLYEVSDPDHLLDRILAVLPRSEGDQFWNNRAQRTGGAVAQTFYWLRRYLSLLGGQPEDSNAVPRVLLALEFRRQHRDRPVLPQDAEGAIDAGVVTLPPARFSPAAWTPRLDVLDTWGVHSTEQWLAWTVRILYFHITSSDPASADAVTREMAPAIYEEYLKRKKHPLEDPSSPLHEWYERFLPPRVDRVKLIDALSRARAIIENEIKPAIIADMKHWMSWHSSLDASVSRFRSDVGRILCAQQPSITWSKVVRDRQVAYFALGTLVASSAAANVGKALLEDLKSFIGRRQADAQTATPLYLFVDEAARIANPALVEIMTMARSSGVRVILAVQTLKGLEKNLEREGAQEIVANCNTRIQLQAADIKDAQAFSEHVGKTRIVQVSKSISEQPNVGESGNRMIDDYQATAGRQMSEKETPRVPSEAIMALPAGEAFIAALGGVALVHFPLLGPTTADVVKEYLEDRP